MAYENYLAAQAAGDPEAVATTESAVQQECIIAGFPSLEACIAQVQLAASVEAVAPIDETAPADVPTPDQVAPEAAPAEEPAPAAVDTPASDPEVDSQAQFQTNLNAALQQYQQALSLADAGDFAAAQPLAEQAAATIQQLCAAEGFASIEACIGQSLPPLPQPPVDATPDVEAETAPATEPVPTEEPAPTADPAPLDEPAPAQEVVPADEPAPTPDQVSPEAAPAEEPAPAATDTPSSDPEVDAQAQFETNLNAALEQYQQALSLADAGGFAAAQPLAEQSAATIQQLCAAEGFASIEACIGQSLPPLPQPPVGATPEVEAETAPATEPVPTEEPTPTADPAPLDEPAAAQEVAPANESAPTPDEVATEAAPVEEPAPASVDTPTSDPEVDAQAQFKTNLNAAVEQYQQALSLADAGDFATAQPLAEQSAATIQQLCAAEGFASIEACIGQSLPPLPQPPVETTPEVEAETAPATELVPTEEPAPTAGPTAVDEPAPAQEIGPTDNVVPTPDQLAPEAAPVEEPAPATVDTPTSDPEVDAEAQFEANLNAALEQYQQALNLADAGDYATAQPLAEQSAATIQQLCVAEGFASIEACIGQSLPPLPQPLVETAPEETLEIAPSTEPTPTDEPVLSEEPAPADESAPVQEDPPTDELAPIGDQLSPEGVPAEELAPAGEAVPQQDPATLPELPSTEQPTLAQEPEAVQEGEPEPSEEPLADPLDQAEADINGAVAKYNSGAARLSSGDPVGQQEMDAASATLQQVCSLLGYGSNEDCVADYGLSLAAPAQEARSPAEPVVGAGQTVTDTAIEQLPEAVAAEEAAPLLDSQKLFTPSPSIVAPAEPRLQLAPQPTAPAVPPPTSDVQAQSTIAPTQSVSVVAEPGEALEPGAVVFAPPQNVTIINQTNVTNNSIVNNNTTLNTNIDRSVDNSVDNSVNVDVDAFIDQSVEDNSVNIETNTTRRPTAADIFGDVDRRSAEPTVTSSVGFVFQLGSQTVIANPEQERQRIYNPQQDEIFYERLAGNRIRETITRPDGVQIVTIRDEAGSVLRRSRISPQGDEAVLVHGRQDVRVDININLESGETQDFGGEYTEGWQDPGENLPPLRLDIPAREYVLDADEANEEDIEVFLRLPPVEPVRRIYSVEEVKHSARIRDTVRRLEIGDLTFDTGRATISRSQVDLLRDIANAMLTLLATNPAETFLIEGHADAQGSEVTNLELSDRRAATVANILTEFYNVPPENLTTQGYGESFLKVRTELPERLNRRVTVRRITPLITIAEQ